MHHRVIDVDLTDYTEARLPSEQKWYALTGRVVDAKVEADGDIHLALQIIQIGEERRKITLCGKFIR